MGEFYQLRVQLQHVEPAIWRRIQVPAAYSFWDLHVAIQDVMGWLDCHLHEFWIPQPGTASLLRIGIPDDEFGGFAGEQVLSGRETPIADHISKASPNILYTYDFGDNWEHLVQLEKVGNAAQGTKFPLCLEGERACPPENCGGVWGYQDLLTILRDKSHPQYEAMNERFVDEFDPEQFDIEVVEFEDPQKRWLFAFGSQ